LGIADSTCFLVSSFFLSTVHPSVSSNQPPGSAALLPGNPSTAASWHRNNVAAAWRSPLNMPDWQQYRYID